MRQLKIILILIACISIFFNACYYDKADRLYPTQGACDTSAVSYNHHITPMLNQQCYACHTGASAGGGIQLGNYNADKAAAQSGKLYGAVSHAPGFSPMPKGGAQLSMCQIATIKKWIDSGTPNN